MSTAVHTAQIFAMLIVQYSFFSLEKHLHVSVPKEKRHTYICHTCNSNEGKWHFLAKIDWKSWKSKTQSLTSCVGYRYSVLQNPSWVWFIRQESGSQNVFQPWHNTSSNKDDRSTYLLFYGYLLIQYGIGFFGTFRPRSFRIRQL